MAFRFAGLSCLLQHGVACRVPASATLQPSQWHSENQQRNRNLVPVHPTEICQAWSDSNTDRDSLPIRSRAPKQFLASEVCTERCENKGYGLGLRNEVLLRGRQNYPLSQKGFERLYTVTQQAACAGIPALKAYEHVQPKAHLQLPACLACLHAGVSLSGWELVYPLAACMPLESVVLVSTVHSQDIGCMMQ